VIRRESAAIRVHDSSGHIVEDATAGAIGIVAAGEDSTAEAVVIAGEDDLNGVVEAAVDPIADTTADTRHSGGHN
jgi:hypothetical protein